MQSLIFQGNKSITYDNGTENVLHNEINQIIGCKSYFCRPYCSQDKWQVENRNIDDFSPINDLISDGDSRGNYKQSSDEAIRMENSS